MTDVQSWQELANRSISPSSFLLRYQSMINIDIPFLICHDQQWQLNFWNQVLLFPFSSLQQGHSAKKTLETPVQVFDKNQKFYIHVLCHFWIDPHKFSPFMINITIKNLGSWSAAKLWRGPSLKSHSLEILWMQKFLKPLRQVIWINIMQRSGVNLLTIGGCFFKACFIGWRQSFFENLNCVTDRIIQVYVVSHCVKYNISCITDITLVVELNKM